jgi:light-regulated signal transduction histidine kinase (bacteriophytochrome)
MGRKRAIRLVIKPLPSAQGHRLMLLQVFANLLSNAVKFTQGHEQAVIEVGGRVEKGESVYYVKDNGIGFDMRYVGRLFAPFHRLHTEEEFEGLGIGLATVQRIIHRHGGRVWAEGKVGEGAALYFALPKA